jgi:hypothetical protein
MTGPKTAWLSVSLRGYQSAWLRPGERGSSVPRTSAPTAAELSLQDHPVFNPIRGMERIVARGGLVRKARATAWSCSHRYCWSWPAAST